MTLSIVVNGKKYKVFVEIGWFKGNDFILFDFQLLNIYAKGSLSLVHLQIAKFVICLSVSD